MPPPRVIGRGGGMVRLQRDTGEAFDVEERIAAEYGLVPLAPLPTAPMGGPGASAPTADLGRTAAPSSDMSWLTPQVQYGTDATPAPAAPVDPDEAARDAIMSRLTGGAPAPAAPAQAPPVASALGPRQVGDVVAPGGAVRPPAPGPQARPGEMPIAPRAAAQDAPAAPARVRRRRPDGTPEPDLIDELTRRPQDAGPLVPGDMRTSSPLEEQQGRIAEGERLAREMANAEAVAAAERQDVLLEAQRQQAELERERNDALNDAQRRYLAATEEARTARVDPTRFFRDRGAAGAIGVAIATALGGIGAALTGGPNRALETIERAIDRDIAAQESNQRNAQANVGNARTFYDITRTQFSDREAAQNAARALAWGQVAERAGQQAAQLRDEGARLRAQELQAEAEQRAAAAQQAAIVAAQDRALHLRRQQAEIAKIEAEAQVAQRRARGGGGGAGRAPTAAAMDAFNRLVDSGVAPADAARQLRIAAPPSGRFVEGGSAASRETSDLAIRINAAEDAVNQVMRALPPSGQDIPGVGRVDSLRGSGFFQSAEGRRMRTLAANAVRRYLRLESGAAISDDEMEQEMAVRGMGPGATEDDFRAGMTDLQRDLQVRARTLRAQAGPPSGEPEAAPPPAGVRRR